MSRNGKLFIAGQNAALMMTQQKAFAEKFHNERLAQQIEDRDEALRQLDPKVWRIFCLRWNKPPPMSGWGDDQTLLIVMHKVRLVLSQNFSKAERQHSAEWLIKYGQDLPNGLRMEDGELRGVAVIGQPEPK
jgi:hypothetical protein